MEIFKLVEERKRISTVLVDLVFEILSQSLVMLVSLSLVFEICVLRLLIAVDLVLGGVASG